MLRVAAMPEEDKLFASQAGDRIYSRCEISYIPMEVARSFEINYFISPGSESLS